MSTSSSLPADVPTKQSQPDLPALFDFLSQTEFPSEFPADAWQILALSTLVAGNHPDTAAAELYKYLLTAQSERYSSTEARQALVRRIREVLFKIVIIVGIPKPLESVLGLDQVIDAKDRDSSAPRDGWTPKATFDRGEALLRRLYGGNLEPIDAKMRNHPDFMFLTRDITYGLFLSDAHLLSAVETELATLAGIVLQNLPSESGWHMRGMRRLGVSRAGVERVVALLKALAAWQGVSVARVGEVGDIEHEVDVE